MNFKTIANNWALLFLIGFTTGQIVCLNTAGSSGVNTQGWGLWICVARGRCSSQMSHNCDGKAFDVGLRSNTFAEREIVEL